jgi:hypothetical protein
MNANVLKIEDDSSPLDLWALEVDEEGDVLP